MCQNEAIWELRLKMQKGEKSGMNRWESHLGAYFNLGEKLIYFDGKFHWGKNQDQGLNLWCFLKET